MEPQTGELIHIPLVVDSARDAPEAYTHGQVHVSLPLEA